MISAGEALTSTNIRQQADINALTYKVPQDMRAVTVPVDDLSGVAGLIQPGNRVDVLVTFDLKNETAITRTVLQDVQVLALSTTMVAEETKPAAPPAPAAAGEKGGQPPAGGQPPPTPADTSKNAYKTATLAVTPADAEKLVLADTKGKIRLSLRHAGDSAFATVPAENNWELIGERPAPPEAKPAPQGQQAPGAQPSQPAPSWYPSPMGPSPGAAPPGGKPAVEAKPGVEVFRGNQREVVQP